MFTVCTTKVEIPEGRALYGDRAGLLLTVYPKKVQWAMPWTVTYSRHAEKQRGKLPERVRAILDALVIEITVGGPVRRLQEPFHHGTHVVRFG